MRQSTRERRYALWIVVAVELLVVLDATVVNIGLPSAQFDLGMSDSRMQWVVAGYSLAFGGLLLLGGRVTDLHGRKKTFLVGLLTFTVASLAGGLAVGEAMLLIARAAQGAAAAFLAPAALAILTTVFPQGPARAKAFAAIGATAGSGGVVGTILGGVLTSYGSWRWCLLVNVPLGTAAVVLAVRHLTESTAERPASYDLPGVITATFGVGTVMYGISNMAADGVLGVSTLVCTLGGLALLGMFVLLERRSPAPMMPIGILADRTRGSAFLIIVLVNAAAYSFYLLLTFYLQTAQDYSAFLTGVAFVPIGLGIFAGSSAAGRLLAVWQARTVTLVGLTVAALGMLPMTAVRSDSPFWTLILPAQLVIGAGVGATLTTVVSLALDRVSPAFSGVASALTNAVREIGGAIGVSALNAVALAAASTGADSEAASTRDYAVAFAVCTGLLVIATMIALYGLRAPTSDARQSMLRGLLSLGHHCRRALPGVRCR